MRKPTLIVTDVRKREGKTEEPVLPPHWHGTQVDRSREGEGRRGKERERERVFTAA
jgi:hypothetical protein